VQVNFWELSIAKMKAICGLFLLSLAIAMWSFADATCDNHACRAACVRIGRCTGKCDFLALFSNVITTFYLMHKAYFEITIYSKQFQDIATTGALADAQFVIIYNTEGTSQSMSTIASPFSTKKDARLPVTKIPIGEISH
jgi:hypothetical protein